MCSMCSRDTSCASPSLTGYASRMHTNVSASWVIVASAAPVMTAQKGKKNVRQLNILLYA